MVVVRFSLCLVATLWLSAGCTAVSLRRDLPPAEERATAKPATTTSTKPPAVATGKAPVAAPVAKPATTPVATPVTPLVTTPVATTPAMVDTTHEDTAPVAPLRLGLLAPLTGRYATYGKAYLEGARAATTEHNARAKHRVEIVPADCTADPLPALQATRKLVESAGVVALLGSVLNAPTLVAAMEANCQGVPLISNVATEDGIAGVGPWVFHVVPTRRAAARESADLAVLQMRRFRAAVVYPDAGDGRSLALAFAERFAELGGEVTLSEPYAENANDFSPLARRIAEAQPEVLYAPLEADDWMLLVPALTFHAVGAQIVGTESLGNEALLRAHGKDLEGAVMPAPDAEVAAPKTARAAARTQTEERLAGAGYAAARRVLDAVSRSPRDDREALRLALEAGVADSAPATATLLTRFRAVRDGRVQPLR